MGFAALAPAALALDPEEPKTLDEPNRLVVAGLSGIPNGFDVACLPKTLVLVLGLDSVLVSFSFSLSAPGDLEGEPKVPPPNRDDASLGAVDFIPKGEVEELNALGPNADVVFGAKSVEGLGDGDDCDDEKKSGTLAVEPKGDFVGPEDVVGVALGVGKEKPEVGRPVASTFGVNPLPADEAGVLLDGTDAFPPKPPKRVGGAGMLAGGLTTELLGVADAPKGDVDEGCGDKARGAIFGFSSSNSFCTDIRKVL